MIVRAKKARANTFLEKVGFLNPNGGIDEVNNDSCAVP